MKIKKKNNVKKISHILAIDGLYTSEKLLENNDFKIIGAIRPNKIKLNVEDIKEKLIKGDLNNITKIIKMEINQY